MSDGLKQKTIRGVWWSSIDRFSSQGVNFLLGILIARQLSPSDYGLIAMLNVFFTFFSAFIDSGFSAALIRKPSRTEADNATVFYYNLGAGLFSTVLFYLLAPLIASFYGLPLLAPVVQVLSATLFIGSLGAIQQSLLSSSLDFKTQAIVSLLSISVSGVLGLWGAHRGMAVWALVLQLMSASILRSALLWLLVRWRPAARFSMDSFRELFGFGSKLLASSLLDIAYGNLYPLVIGKLYTPANLGNYSKAHHLAQFPSANITSVIQRVTFPVLSAIQDQDERLGSSYRKLLRMSTFAIFPMMLGLAAVAKPFIATILTDKWLDTALYLQIICLGLMWYPVHALNLNLLQIKGRSDLFLRLELVKKGLGLCILIATIPHGLVVLCLGQVGTSLLCLLINTHYTSQLIGVSFSTQMKDILPSLLASLLMGGLTYMALPWFSHPYAQLIGGIIIGGIIYAALVWIFRFPELDYVKELLHKR